LALALFYSATHFFVFRFTFTAFNLPKLPFGWGLRGNRRDSSCRKKWNRIQYKMQMRHREPQTRIGMRN